MENHPADTADKDKNLTDDVQEGGPKQTVEAPAEPADTPEVTDEKETRPGKHAKAKENLSVLWTFISTFIVACIVIAALGLVVVKVSGCYLFSIETGSMTPSYPVNTVVVVKPYNSFDEIEVGDVITYVMNEEGSTVTHRVVEIDDANETVTTQGDANDTADASPVLYGNVVGKVIIGIPKIGKVVKVITAEENRNIIIVVIVVILAWAFAWDWVRKLIRRRKAKKNQE